MLSTTFFLTCAAWVIFRARSMTDAWYILTHWFRDWQFDEIKTQHFQLKYLPVALGAILLLESIQMVRSRIRIPEVISTWPATVRWATYLGLVFLVILLGVYRSSEFIYFQF